MNTKLKLFGNVTEEEIIEVLIDRLEELNKVYARYALLYTWQYENESDLEYYLEEHDVIDQDYLSKAMTDTAISTSVIYYDEEENKYIPYSYSSYLIKLIDNLNLQSRIEFDETNLRLAQALFTLIELDQVVEATAPNVKSEIKDTPSKDKVLNQSYMFDRMGDKMMVSSWKFLDMIDEMIVKIKLANIQTKIVYERIMGYKIEDTEFMVSAEVIHSQTDEEIVEVWDEDLGVYAALIEQDDGVNRIMYSLDGLKEPWHRGSITMLNDSKLYTYKFASFDYSLIDGNVAKNHSLGQFFDIAESFTKYIEKLAIQQKLKGVDKFFADPMNVQLTRTFKEISE